MNSLKKIIATPKTGSEHLEDNGKKIEYNLLCFWRWSVSDILSNATRGRFAEFVVGTAVELDPTDLRDEWDAYDLTTSSGIRIEVKSAAYIQSWNQKKYSTISFSIKPAKLWDAKENMRKGGSARPADVYVFCRLKHKEQETINPLKMEQWDFYVLPTFVLDNYGRSQSSITINSLVKLSSPIEYLQLNEEIVLRNDEQRKYTSDKKIDL